MCGICGIIDWKKNLSDEKRQELVIAMNKAISHRGPDTAGLTSQKQSTLAMSRLAIIDEGGGQQPFFNERKDIYIVFNGEIYNFQSLKKDLQNQGYFFKSNSDTEVLIKLYEAHGKNMLPMLKGMFAFCIHDLRTNSYFIARDAFGEKPFYYHWGKGMFSFSSEIKSLLENTMIDRNLNHEALPYYFRTSLVPEPITLLKNIKSLPPGSYLKLSEANFEEAIYFEPSYTATPRIKTEGEALEILRPLLENAVKRQTVSDVPIGAFLSGGIDSSTVVALLQKNSSQSIKTFNVRFEQQAYDESAIAKKVAAHCGTDHHEVFIPNVDFSADIFWEIIDHVGLPFRDSSAIPSFLISQEIAKQVKVALSGDGGDELFGGYAIFNWYQKITRFKNIVSPVRSILNGGLELAQQLPLFKNASSIRKIKRGVQTSLLPLEDIPIALNEMFNEADVAKLLDKNKTTENKYPLLKNYPSSFEQWSPLRKIMYYRLKHTLPANMLIKIDRMSMANSLEVRAPFLDPDLFEASTQLADDLLIKNGTGKYILRKLIEADLPEEVFTHPKMGFSIPLYQYQNNAFKELAQQLLFEENPWPDLFDKKQLEEIYYRGIHSKKDTATRSVFQTAHQLWMMMQLFGWAKRFNVNV